MNNYIFLALICLWQIPLFNSNIYYRPMSKRPIDFGEDVCYYEDISNDFKLMYVKGCPSGKTCSQVEAGDISEYKIHTCQNSPSSFTKRQYNEACDPGLYECLEGSNLECKDGGSGKCTYITTPSTGTSSTCTIYQQVDNGALECVPEAEIASVGILCYKKTSSGEIKYTHYSTENGSKTCKKLNIKETGTNTGKYQIESKELVIDLYSIPDGDYVDDTTEIGSSNISNDYCQSGFSLYFFGNHKQISSDTKMFKRCVTVLDLMAINDGSTTSYLIKYKINNGEEHIYDTSKLSDDAPEKYKTNQNQECEDYLVWPKFDLLKLMIEEYKAQNGPSNKYIKWKFLHTKPKYYLLYKDQPEVLDYLIQNEGNSLDYVPEGLNGQIPNEDITQPITNVTTNTTNDTEAEGTEGPNNQSSGFLKIKYLFILLFLYVF